MYYEEYEYKYDALRFYYNYKCNKKCKLNLEYFLKYLKYKSKYIKLKN